MCAKETLQQKPIRHPFYPLTILLHHFFSKLLHYIKSEINYLRHNARFNLDYIISNNLSKISLKRKERTFSVICSWITYLEESWDVDKQQLFSRTENCTCLASHAMSSIVTFKSLHFHKFILESLLYTLNTWIHT